MARVLLVALACCAVRADQYGGGAVPQYGGGVDYELPAHHDDYRGHAPDAAPPLDYKYQEDTHGDAEKRDVGPELRKRSDGKRRPQRGSLGDELDREELEPEEPSEPKSSRRHSRRGDRGRKGSRRELGAPPRRRGSEAGRERRQHGWYEHFDTDVDHRGDEDGRRDDEDRWRHGTTTERIIRRKPRDRYIPEGAVRHIGIDDEDDKILNRPTQADEWPETEREEPAGGGLVPGPGPPPPPDRDFDADREPDRRLDTDQRPKFDKYKNYPDYGDYYDMKRVNNIKGKIPTLLHRTTAVTTGVRRTTEPGLVHAPWPERRAGESPPPPAPPPALATTAAPTSESTPLAVEAPELVVTLTSSPPPPSPPSPPAAPPAAPPAEGGELSVAEKSRLSILRKAQMKEGPRGSSTRKPPVLLQATRRAPTVVMVEAGGAGDGWARARSVADDTPETLDKVKRLMRTKLVARAADIRDLTDDWDRLVCDYIDTSLLESRAPAALSLALTALLALLPPLLAW